MRRMVFCAVMATLGPALASCSVNFGSDDAAKTSTTAVPVEVYTKDQLVDDLVDEGISPEIAVCVVDEVVEAGIPLKKFGEMSTYEEVKIEEAADKCVAESLPEIQ